MRGFGGYACGVGGCAAGVDHKVYDWYGSEYSAGGLVLRAFRRVVVLGGS